MPNPDVAILAASLLLRPSCPAPDADPLAVQNLSTDVAAMVLVEVPPLR